jgi:hypothetical protein
MSVFCFQNNLTFNWVCSVRSAVLVTVSMMKSMFWDVMSEYTVRETAAFYGVLSITGVMESSLNIWLNHDCSVNVCRILCMRSGHSSLKLVQYFIMRNPETTYIFNVLMKKYRYVILSDNHHLPLPVGSFVTLQRPSYRSLTRPVLQLQEVTNDSFETKIGSFIITQTWNLNFSLYCKYGCSLYVMRVQIAETNFSN